MKTKTRKGLCLFASVCSFTLALMEFTNRDSNFEINVALTLVILASVAVLAALLISDDE